MKVSLIASFLYFLIVSFAYTISEGSIKISSISVHFGEFNTQEIKQLSIESPKDKIEIELKLKQNLDKKPHQTVITLGDNKGLDVSYVPAFNSGNLIKLSISAKKIPEVLKIQDKLFLNLIVGDFNQDSNLYKQLVEIIPSDEFKSTSKYEPKSKMGIKPEINHIFKEDSATINPIVPLIFICGATALFFGLLVSWISLVGSNLFGTFKKISCSQLIYNIGFLASLFGFEINFVKYYLGQSIFSTLFNSFVLALPSIYFGSKVLRSLATFRKIGKA